MAKLRYPDPALADDGIRLRPWAESDIACVQEAGADPRIRRGTTVPSTVTGGAALAFVHRQWNRLDTGDGVSLAIADRATDRACGLVFLGLRPQQGVAGIGYWVVPRARGAGRAARAVRLVTCRALERMDVARVEAWVEADNAASRRALLAPGFRREGVLRNFLAFDGERGDAVVFSRIP